MAESLEKTRSDMTAEIDRDADDLYSGGKRNHLTDLACSMIAIAASFVAVVLVAAHQEQTVIVATVAGLPALCGALQQVIDFRGRAAWYFEKAAHLAALGRSLRYEGIPIEDASRRWSDLDTSMEKRWSEFVKAASPPRSAK